MPPFSAFKKRAKTFCQKLFGKSKPTGSDKWKLILDEAVLEMNKAIPKHKDSIYKCEKDAATCIANGDLRLAYVKIIYICKLNRKIDFCKIAPVYATMLSDNVKTLFENINCPRAFLEPVACLCYAADHCDDLPSLTKFKKEISKNYFFRDPIDVTYYPHVTQEVVRFFSFPTPSADNLSSHLCDLAVRYKVFQCEQIPHDLKVMLKDISDALYT